MNDIVVILDDQAFPLGVFRHVWDELLVPRRAAALVPGCGMVPVFFCRSIASPLP
ncbi:hypothetical protein [Paracidovorax valerianellae]|uniref:hypothetical protein n=1 Tax=Paracidovorax valerianellae TaxID=187868 RepID=UPI00158798CC|nr:hypothetical protein [Paracidovorax valerianellae]MDA8446888.1 hypothetical protein [Paracidovorax valerianellae]